MVEEKIEGNDVKEPDTQVEKNEETPDWAKKRISEISAQKNEFKEKYEAMLKEQEDAKAKDLEEQGKYQELLKAEQEKTQNLEVKAKLWNEYEAKTRDGLLSKLPEDKKEQFKGYDLKALESIVDMIVKKDNPEHDPNKVEKKEVNGGYKTKTEWIKKDPKGFRKAKSDGLI